MKSSALTVILFLYTALSAGLASGATTRFDLQSSILSAPCVSVLDSSITYALDLSYDGTSFQLSSATEISLISECSGSFDPATNVYTDTVRAGDDLYTLALKLEPGNFFSVESASFLRHGQSSLWRVSNGVNEVLIGGTIHILRDSDKPLPAIFDEAYSAAEILVTEISSQDLGNISAFTNFLLDPSGENLSSRISNSTTNSLIEYLNSTTLELTNLEPLRAVWAASTIVFEETTKPGYGPGVDDHYMTLATQDSKLNIGLETVVSQLLAINSTNAHLTDDQIILDALEAVNDERLGTEIEALITAWREGDDEYLNAVAIQPAKEESLDDYNTIFTNRNSEWVPQIEVFLTTPEVELVLVGVGHLVGDESVLNMLEALGYSVTSY